MSNLRQLGISAQVYTADHDGSFPLAYDYGQPALGAKEWDFFRDSFINPTAATPGFLWQDSGHMAVHLMRPGREPYADSRPTSAEAETALRTYASYFGPYTIHEAEGYLVHHRVGTTNPNSMGSDAQRFYELSEDHLILRPPARTIDGREVQSALTWGRLRDR